MLRKVWIMAVLLLCLSGCQSERAHAPDKQAVRSVMPAVRVTVLPDRVAEQVGRMSDAQKVGQLFFARCPEKDAAAFTAQYQPGGLLLFGRDFEGRTPDSLREFLTGCQNAAGVPLLIGVDEEGGTVTRVSGREGFRAEKFRAPQAVFAAGGWEELARDTSEKDRLLRSLGINVNLAPVADVCTDPDAFMYARAFGQGAAETALFASAVVRQMGEDGIGSVVKHFPGFGSNEDTHTGVIFDERTLEELRACDLIPFDAAIRAGADAVLVSHHVVLCMDDERPASLSPAAYALLREELGFEGVAVTDDLGMGAVAQYAGSADAAVQAVNAGSDMLLSSDLPVQYAAVLAAVESGEIPAERLNEAVYRVLRWKRSLRIWRP